MRNAECGRRLVDGARNPQCRFERPTQTCHLERLPNMSCRAEPAGAERRPVCGVETSPEEHECGVLLGGASRAVGTGATTGAGVGSSQNSTTLVQLRGSLHALARARLVEMTGEEGDEGAFEACHPERSRGVSRQEWGASKKATKKPSKRVTPSGAGDGLLVEAAGGDDVIPRTSRSRRAA